MNKRFSVIILLIFLTNSSFSQELNDFFLKLYKINIFNGSVAISNADEKIFSNTYGFSNFEKQEKINGKSQFPIASITKTFTSTAILQLKQKGKLKIDDPVKKYLQDFPYPNVSIRQLLNNTSGLAQYYNLFDSIIKEQPEKLISNKDIIPVFIRFKTPLAFVPGSKWDYNNVNFCLAAMIIEKVSGISFAEYLDKNIFKPAKMKDSFVPKSRKIKTKNQVEQYSYPNSYSTKLVNINILKETFLIETKSNFYGNGGIVSTALDLHKYQKALFSHQLLGKSELEEALIATKLNDGKMATFLLEGKEVSYGLGWFIYTNQSDGKIVFHDGAISGLTSILVYNIDKNQTVILLSNTGGSAVFPTSNAALQLINNKPYTIPLSNLSRIYGNLLETDNTEKANRLIDDYLKKPSGYNVTERDFIRLGYEFLRLQKADNALQTFYSATLLFPKSWNAYDSYGEALLKFEKKDDAIKMYRKSVELNPDNINGKKVLDELLK